MGLKFKQGDWVKGSSSQSELVHGYVETVDLYQRFLNVRVIACDNKQMVGRTISLLNHTVEHLPVYELDNEGHLYNLIDLALATRDKKWFLDLTKKLNGIETSHRSRRHLPYQGRINGYRSNHG